MSIEQLADVDLALMHLKAARGCLLRADCPKALRKVRKAISSTKGAKRNVRNRSRR